MQVAACVLRLLVSVSLILGLTQCSLGPRAKSREARLEQLGYVPLKLQKLRGDVRFSGTFGVNGRPLRFLIDSGANSTDVSNDYAEEVGLERDQRVSVVSRGALGRKVHSGLGLGTLQMGPMLSQDFPFTIGPTSDRRTATSRYAGQIGLDALSSAGSLVDISRGTLWVPGIPARGRRALGPTAGLGRQILALNPADRFPHLLLDVDVDGTRTVWVVDTGAEVSVMAEESFRRFRLPSQVTNARMIDAAGDRIRVRAASLYNIRVGNEFLPRVDLVVAPLKNVREVFRDRSGRPVDGILGMDFLTGSEALLDTRSRLLYRGLPR